MNRIAGELIKNLRLVFLYFRDYVIYFMYRNKRFKEARSSTNKMAFVFGNGPGLASFLENKNSMLVDSVLFVCNGFVLTEYFETLKPEYYILKDPLYFDFGDEKVKNKSVPVVEIWENLFLKTKWKINIFVALTDLSVLESIKNRFGQNPNISFSNIFPVVFKSNKRFQFYNEGLGLVGGMTVVHLSLQIAILMNFKEIYLAGVDHDWFENIKYDNDNNKVCLINKHFYGESKLYYSEGILKDIDLQVEFDTFSKSLKGFKDLQRLAKFKNISIFRTTRSFLHFIPFKNFRSST